MAINKNVDALYSFFTPKWVCEEMIYLAEKYGYSKKKHRVLEPSAGNGNFLELLNNKLVDAYELNLDNYNIAKKRAPNVNLQNLHFEKHFLECPRYTKLKKKIEQKYDLVIGNPPYGKYTNYFSGFFKRERTYQQFENFFIYKGLEVLKSGGLLVYIVPSSFIRNKESKLKKDMDKIAEVVDAYRMPDNIFEKTKVPTDIVVLKRK